MLDGQKSHPNYRSLEWEAFNLLGLARKFFRREQHSPTARPKCTCTRHHQDHQLTSCFVMVVFLLSGRQSRCTSEKVYWIVQDLSFLWECLPYGYRQDVHKDFLLVELVLKRRGETFDPWFMSAFWAAAFVYLKDVWNLPNARHSHLVASNCIRFTQIFHFLREFLARLRRQ